MSLGERLKILRNRERQEEFGAKFGVSATQISKIEKGFSNPSPELAISICKYYNRSLDWFWTGEEREPIIEKNILEPESTIPLNEHLDLLRKYNKLLEQENEKQAEQLRERPLH